jgi:F-type H+-transporting ATPase subunit b
MNFNLTMIAQALSFALFIWIAVVWIWPMILVKIETRQKLIADGRSSLAEANKQTEVLLRDARSRAHELMTQAERAAAQRVEEAKVQAKTEADRIVAAAKAQIDQEVQSARQQLRDQVAALAVAGAEKILRREVDARAHADMLDRLKAQI